MSRRPKRYHCPVGNRRASNKYISVLAAVVLLQQESKRALYTWTEAVLHGHGLSCPNRRHGDSSDPDANGLDFESQAAAKNRCDSYPVPG